LHKNLYAGQNAGAEAGDELVLIRGMHILGLRDGKALATKPAIAPTNDKTYATDWIRVCEPSPWSQNTATTMIQGLRDCYSLCTSSASRLGALHGQITFLTGSARISSRTR